MRSVERKIGLDGVARKSADAAMRQLLEVRSGERVLVVTDEHTRAVGETFSLAADALGATSVLYVLPEARRPLAGLPDELSALIPGTNLAVTCFTGLAAETPFRILLIRALAAAARRLAHGPGITPGMLRDGPMGVDYRAMGQAATRLIERLAGAKSAHVTAPAGTDITLDVSGRAFETDAVLADGHWGNIPAGEVWCGPVENGANGILVCDGSIGDLGAVPAPVRLEVRAGRVVDTRCADARFRDVVREVLSLDDEAGVVGELGIGLNPGARVTGNLLEDEKAIRTVHVAFGCNDFMPGGRNRSRTHRDFLVREPTLTVSFEGGRTERVLVDGEVIPGG